MKIKSLQFKNLFKRKKPPAYGDGENWPAYGSYLPPPGRSLGRTKTFGQKMFRKVVWAGIILIILLAVRESPGPLGQRVKNDLRYVLTTEWNYEPLVQKVVQFGLQLANVDTPEINHDAIQVFAPQNPDKGLPLPVSGKVVKHFGWIKDELDGMERFHAGIDIAASEKAPVLAVIDGKVKKIGLDPKLGQYVLLEHGDGCLTLYAQLQNISVQEAQKVQAGQNIAEVSTVGDIDGFGLHFEFRENNQLVDPLKRLRTFGQDW